MEALFKNNCRIGVRKNNITTIIIINIINIIILKNIYILIIINGIGAVKRKQWNEFNLLYYLIK